MDGFGYNNGSEAGRMERLEPAADATVAASELLKNRPGIEKADAIWATKPDIYLKACGSYCEWSQVVDLSPPSKDVSVPEEDKKFIYFYYNSLQYMLYELGFPETKDRSGKPVRIQKERVTIAILSNPIEVVGILLEAGRQCPGDVLLILSTTWLEKKKADPVDGLECYSLFVHKAIEFKADGRSAIRVYQPPRKVTYCINFFTQACTGAMRNDGRELERNLDCTMNTVELALTVDDKLWTRTKMAEAGVGVPKTLAFAFQPRHDYQTSTRDEFGEKLVTVVQLDTKMDAETTITDAVREFVSSSTMQEFQQVVVKPSGEMWMACMGVSFHVKSDIQSIVGAALRLLRDVQRNDAILVEAFYPTLVPCRSDEGLKERPPWACAKSNACRFRATVCRGPDDKAHMTKMVCGVGCKNDPVGGDNSVGQSLDTTLIAFGHHDPISRRRIYHKLKQAAEVTLTAIMDHEKTMNPRERGSRFAQTDLIGIDFILYDGNKDGGGGFPDLRPVVIEVNSMCCTTNCDLYEWMYRESHGEAFQPFVETMVACSQRNLLRDKSFLLLQGGESPSDRKMTNGVGSGSAAMLNGTESRDESWAIIQQMALEYEIKVAVASPTLTDHITDLNDNITSIKFDQLFDPTMTTDDHATALLQLIGSTASRTIDACMSFDPHTVPFASRVHQLLGLPGGTSDSGSRTVLDRLATQRMLTTRNDAIPQWSPSHLYSALFGHNGYAGEADQTIKDAIEQFGTSGHLKDLTRILTKSLPLYHICIVVHKRRLIGAVVGFQNCNGNDVIEVETDLPSDKRNQLIIASYQCCNEMSLISGVFDVRMTFNAIVPKLIEIEPCLPMTSASHRFYRQVRSSCGVDLIACALLIGCDIQPMLPVEHSFLNMLRSRKCNFEQTERIWDAQLLLNGTD